MQDGLNKVQTRAMLLTGGYLILTWMTLALSYTFERRFSFGIWLTALFFSPLALFTVWIFFRNIHKKIVSGMDRTILSKKIRLIPFKLTFLLYFFNFTIFLSGVFYETISIMEIAEAMLMGMLMGGYLFFGFEVITFTYKEWGLSSPLTKVFPRFRTKLLVTFMVYSLFPLLFLFLKIVYLSQMESGQNITVQAMLPTLIRTGMLVVISGLILAWSIIKPVTRLVEDMKNVEKGDFTQDTPVYSTDEFGQLQTGFNSMIASLREKEHLRSAFGRYVSPDIVDAVSHGDSGPGGKRTNLSVLFTDLRSFTAMSERMEAETIVSLLNRYFGAMVDVVTEHHGSVNKFIGDAILAIFDEEDHPLHALSCAASMEKALVELNEEFIRDYGVSLKAGYGVHSGEVILGSIGSSSRLEYTVMGDTVNTASRLESFTKKLERPILASATLVDSIAPEKIQTLAFSAMHRLKIKLRGKEELVSVYSCSI